MNLTDTVARAIQDFKTFVFEIFKYSFPEHQWIHPSHWEKWAPLIQNNPDVILVAPRGHLKSTIMYAYVMWRLFRNLYKDELGLYISYNQDLARYHVKNIKTLIERNPFFKSLRSLKQAESGLKYTWDNENKFELIPVGVFSALRGYHADFIILDDVLAVDNSSTVDYTMLEKVKRIYLEAIQYIRNPGGEIKIIGTPMLNSDPDLLAFLRDNDPKFKYYHFPAITDFEKKEVLWPQRYTYEELIRYKEQNPVAFMKELMCQPLSTLDTYLDNEILYRNVRKGYKGYVNLDKLRKDFAGSSIYAGFDIGKKRHPSHLTVLAEKDNKIWVVYHKFMDGWDYTRQINFLLELQRKLGIDYLFYDNTRGEFEVFKENYKIPPNWQPITFTKKLKHAMATVLDSYLTKNKLVLPDDGRFLNSLMMINNNLESQEKAGAHGDAFWSLAMALYGFEQELGDLKIAVGRWFL